MIKCNSCFPASGLNFLPESSVGSHSPGNRKFPVAEILCRFNAVSTEHIHNSFLKRSRHICPVYFFPLHLTLIQIIQNRGLQSAETEIIRRIVHFCPWKLNRFFIAFSCQSFDLWTSRIAETDGPGHLVKGLSRSIVPSTPDDFIDTVIFYIHQMCMSAGYNKT